MNDERNDAVNLLIPYVRLPDHNDPLFAEFTYGDLEQRGRKLRKLEPGDNPPGVRRCRTEPISNGCRLATSVAVRFYKPLTSSLQHSGRGYLYRLTYRLKLQSGVYLRGLRLSVSEGLANDRQTGPCSNLPTSQGPAEVVNPHVL